MTDALAATLRHCTLAQTQSYRALRIEAGQRALADLAWRLAEAEAYPGAAWMAETPAELRAKMARLRAAGDDDIAELDALIAAREA